MLRKYILGLIIGCIFGIPVLTQNTLEFNKTQLIFLSFVMEPQEYLIEVPEEGIVGIYIELQRVIYLSLLELNIEILQNTKLIAEYHLFWPVKGNKKTAILHLFTEPGRYLLKLTTPSKVVRTRIIPLYFKTPVQSSSNPSITLEPHQEFWCIFVPDEGIGQVGLYLDRLEILATETDKPVWMKIILLSTEAKISNEPEKTFVQLLVCSSVEPCFQAFIEKVFVKDITLKIISVRGRLYMFVNKEG